MYSDNIIVCQRPTDSKKTQILGLNFSHISGEYLIFTYSFLDLKLLSVVTISVACRFKMSCFHFIL